jgi:HK97 family phage portal protein
MTATATWNEARQRAAAPGSPILTQWRNQRQAARASVQNSVQVIASSDPRMLELFGVSPSAAGIHVTPDSSRRVAAVSACERLISCALASMPVNVYEKEGAIAKMVDEPPLWWLLNEQPTARFTAASHWEGVGSATLMRGDAFSYIGRDKMGTPRELIPLPWEAVTPERYKVGDGWRLKYFIHDIDTWGCDQDDMLHFPGFGFNGLRGMSVIAWAARNAAGTALAMDEYSGRFFAGGAHPSITLEVPGDMKQGAIDQLREAFASKYSGIDNAHKLPLVLTNGVTAKPLSINAEDMQLLDARKYGALDIARAFGVPPFMIGETSASTSWGSGIESMGRAFVNYTLSGHLNRIEQELNRKLYRTARRFLAFDRAALTQGDSKAQDESDRAALGGPGTGAGYMSVDEVRARRNLEPRGGKYAEIFYPEPGAKPEPKPGATK